MIFVASDISLYGLIFFRCNFDPKCYSIYYNIQPRPTLATQTPRSSRLLRKSSCLHSFWQGQCTHPDPTAPAILQTVAATVPRRFCQTADVAIQRGGHTILQMSQFQCGCKWKIGLIEIKNSNDILILPGEL
jgi:hypothetical protein